MTEKGVIEYVKTQLGSKTVDVEITNKEYETLIQQAIKIRLFSRIHRL